MSGANRAVGAEVLGACTEVAQATIHMPRPDGGAPLAQVLGGELAEALCQRLAEMLANTLPGALTKTIADDVLQGAEPIAAFLGLSARQLYHLVQQGALPVFRLGATICARKSTLLKWIAEQEGAAGK